MAPYRGDLRLLDRVKKRKDPSEKEKKVDQVAKKQIPPKKHPEEPKRSPAPPKLTPPKDNDKKNDVEVPTIAIMRDFAELSTEAKAKIQKEEKIVDANESWLNISHPEFPPIDFSIRRQDIFKSGAEVIINAANDRLGIGGGIDGLIHKKGGADYKKAHQGLRKLEPYKEKFISGHAAMIPSGDLKNDGIHHVIVVAGPNTGSKEKDKALYSCYYNSLVLADAKGIKKLAFPSIATGYFGFPKDRAAQISLKAVFDFLTSHKKTSLTTISIHFLGKETDALQDYKNALIA